MYQREKEKRTLSAKLSQLLVGGAMLLAASPAYAFANGSSVHRTAAATTTLIAQQTGHTLTGTVTDENGEPVIGANVKIKGEALGTITDIDGRFTLKNVSDKAVLQVSYIGYKNQDLKVGSQKDLSIRLQEDSELIDEVVVVGYATQKKVNLTGSVASVDMADIAEKRPVTNLSNALAGMAAGVAVTSSNNIPGDEGNATIMVRGQGTLNNSEPLVIIDGVEANINTVSPQDVASMSVLKDAASASIYGSRAANGVILITTKKGQSGKVSIDYTGYVSVESIGKTVRGVSDYATYMDLMNEAYSNSGQPIQFKPETIAAWRNDAGRNPLQYPNTDWVDEVFRSAVATNHNLAVSGGTDKVSFYTSFGYNNDPGLMENSGYERYSFRTSVEARITPWLTLGTKLNGYYSNSEVGQDRVDDVFTYGVASTPGMTLKHDGKYGSGVNPEDDPQSNNPLEYLNKETGFHKNRNLRAQFNAELKPLKGLTLTGSYTYELLDKEQMEKPTRNDLWNFATNTIGRSGADKSYIYNKNRKIERYFMDATARYEKKFLDNRLSFNLLAGASQEMRRDRKFTAQAYDWIDPSIDVIDGTTGESVTSGSHSEWAMRSFFGRINLGWKDRYLLEANMRADASSRFRPDNRWGYFPSVSAAWRVDQESFMESTRSWLDALKLRLSYGELGNNYVGDYDAIATYAKSNYGLNGVLQTGLAQTAIANGSLSWESTAVTNVALDFGVLNSRLSGTLEYFHKKTSDILIDLPAPLVHGSGSLPKQNSAEVVNKGLELTLNWADKINDFHYYIGGNLTFVDNKVTKFKGDEMSISDKGNKDVMIKEGYAINTQYVLIADRIVQTQADLDYIQSLIDNAPMITDDKGNQVKQNPFSKYKRPELGDILYKDTNHDGIFSDEDRVPMGHGDTPRFTYSINLGFEYKGFDFSTLMQGSGNYYVQYRSLHNTNVAYGNQIGESIVDGRWYPGRTTPAEFPRLLKGDGRNSRNSTLWESNRSFLKIRNIQLGYTLPAQWVKAASLSRVRLFCSLENFFTFTNYQGMDPEVSGLGYPAIRQASFGLNVSF